jgi:hypothetical protein
VEKKNMNIIDFLSQEFKTNTQYKDFILSHKYVVRDNRTTYENDDDPDIKYYDNHTANDIIHYIILKIKENNNIETKDVNMKKLEERAYEKNRISYLEINNFLPKTKLLTSQRTIGTGHSDRPNSDTSIYIYEYSDYYIRFSYDLENSDTYDSDTYLYLINNTFGSINEFMNMCFTVYKKTDNLYPMLQNLNLDNLKIFLKESNMTLDQKKKTIFDIFELNNQYETITI